MLDAIFQLDERSQGVDPVYAAGNGMQNGPKSCRQCRSGKMHYGRFGSPPHGPCPTQQRVEACQQGVMAIRWLRPRQPHAPSSTSPNLRRKRTGFRAHPTRRTPGRILFFGADELQRYFSQNWQPTRRRAIARQVYESGRAPPGTGAPNALSVIATIT